MPSKEEMEKIVADLSAPLRATRIKAVMVLGEIGSDDVVEPLITAMKDEDFGVRSYAAEYLGQIGDKRAVAPLIEALNDAFYHVRLDACIALGKMGDPRTMDALTATMMRHNTGFSHEDDRVYEAAKEALEKIQHVEAPGIE